VRLNVGQEAVGSTRSELYNRLTEVRLDGCRALQRIDDTSALRNSWDVRV
jgi:hypothetical protein